MLAIINMLEQRRKQEIEEQRRREQEEARRRSRGSAGEEEQRRRESSGKKAPQQGEVTYGVPYRRRLSVCRSGTSHQQLRYAGTSKVAAH